MNWYGEVNQAMKPAEPLIRLLSGLSIQTFFILVIGAVVTVILFYAGLPVFAFIAAGVAFAFLVFRIIVTARRIARIYART